MKSTTSTEALAPVRTTPRTIIRAAGDILFLRRLLNVNDCLWLGEWVFHVSFVFVVLRHARYFVNPVPRWIWELQVPGIIAGYVLPLSLTYILVMKMFIEKKQYVSSYNLFLVLMLLVLSASGLLMFTSYPTDIIAAKDFAMGVVTFIPAALPHGMLFSLHVIIFLLLAAYLPAHVFSAPLVMLDARRREEGLDMVMHED